MTGIQVNSIYNVPNALTSIRFALAVAVMALIPFGRFTAALVVFSIAVSTDWMDGYWARKYGQVTKLGRIFDPFVDKIIICGTFIALVEVPESGVASWMATIVVARELLVTSLRAMIEGAGGDFSARDLGKWKMVLQCAAAIAILLLLIYPDVVWLTYVAPLLLWAAILLTLYSGYDYVMIAAPGVKPDALGGVMSEAIYYALDKLLILAAIASTVMWGRILIRGRGESATLLDAIVPVRPRERPFWSLADAMVMFGTHLLLLALVHTWMTSQGWIVSPDSDPDEVSATHAQFANIGMVVIAGLGSIGVTLGWLRLMNDKPMQRLSLTSNGSDVWLGLKASVMVLPPVLLVSSLVSLLLPYNHEVLSLLQGVESNAIFLGMFFATAIVTPAFEELLFRVLIQGGLQGMMDPGESEGEELPSDTWRPRSYLPIIIASVIFALLHLGQGAAPVPLFLLSLGLGYLYRQTGNITAPFVVHAMLNSLTMIAKFTETPAAG